MTARLIGVGVGPGDPELVTVRALRELERADWVFVPVADTGETGRAEAVVQAHLSAELRRISFAVSGDARARAASWQHAASQVAAQLEAGGTACFATIGDPNLYSTFTQLARAVTRRLPEVVVETIPGITAMQELAARSNTVLCEGTETLVLLPLTSPTTTLQDAFDRFDTVVCYKGGRQLADVLEAGRSAGRLEGAVYGEHLGLAGEKIRAAGAMAGRSGPYLSTVILPAATRKGAR